jgi:hypothetical protein
VPAAPASSPVPVRDWRETMLAEQAVRKVEYEREVAAHQEREHGRVRLNDEREGRARVTESEQRRIATGELPR